MKTLLVLEIMWFTICAFALGFGIYRMITAGAEESIGFFVISLLAFVIGFMRRKQRIKGNKN